MKKKSLDITETTSLTTYRFPSSQVACEVCQFFISGDISQKINSVPPYNKIARSSHRGFIDVFAVKVLGSIFVLLSKPQFIVVFMVQLTVWLMIADTE